MAKRFTASDKWKKVWFRKLPVEYKMFWIYLLDQCDYAGIWDVDFESASFLIGKEINSDKATEFLKSQIHIFKNGNKWFVLDFISFQYGNLHRKSNTHKSVLSLLEKYPELKPLLNPCKRVTDTDTDTDKDKDVVMVNPVYKPKTDTVSLLVYGFKEKTGIAMDNRDWDKVNWGWASKEAKKMIDYLKLSDVALECLSELCDYYISKGLSWNFVTVTKGMADWKVQKDKYGKFYGPGWRKKGEGNDLD